MVNENSNINLEDLKGYEHLFDNSRARYICPIFQRKFMWKVKGGTGKSQIIDFWADLEPVIFPENDDEHYVYLGAMIFKKYPESTSPYSVIDYLIIDGQQRMTTFNIFFLALASICKDSEFGDNLDSIQNVLFLSGININYLSRFHPTTSNEDPNSDDKSIYFSLIKDIYGDIADEFTFNENIRSTNKMFQAYQYFRNELISGLREIDEKDKESFIEKMINRLVKNVLFSQIYIPSNLNVNQIFDRLNTKGEKLSVMDLVRNEIFKNFGVRYDSEIAKEVKRNHWDKFSENLKSNDENEKDRSDDFFLPYSLILDNNSSGPKSFDVMKEHWRQMTDPNELDEEDSGVYAIEALNDMKKYVNSFKNIAYKKPNINLNDYPESLQQRLIRLQRLDVPKTSFSMLMEIISKNSDALNDFACKVIDLFESFIIRRVFAADEQTGIDKIFKNFVRRSDYFGMNFQKVVDYMNSFPTQKFYNDEEFKENILIRDLYSAKGYFKFITMEYEISIRNENHINEQEYNSLQVHHILPQNRPQNSNWSTVFNSNAHKKYKDTWANLVPLSAPLNQMQSNTSYENFKSLLGENFSQSASAKRIVDTFDNWTEYEIKERSKELFDWAKNRWKWYPPSN